MSISEFRETLAFSEVIALARVPKETLDRLLGEVLIENLHNIIASVYSPARDDLLVIKQLIEDPQVHDFARASGMRSLLTLVKENKLERQSVIDYFEQLFDYPTVKSDSVAISNLILVCCDLYAKELYPIIAPLCDSGYPDMLSLIEPDWIKTLLPKDDVSLDHGVLADVAWQYGFVKNTIDQMQWWDCFDSNAETGEWTHCLPDLEPNFDAANEGTTYYRDTSKVGRNDPCPCGSGKKFKKCC